MTTTQQRGEETRQRILDEALKAFARYGYDATGVAEICRRADITKGGFYYHFPSKQAVFLEMLEQWLGRIDSQMAAIRSEGKSVPQELLGITAMARQVFQEAGGKLPIFFEFLTKASHSQVVWAATVVPLRKYRAFFADMVADGREEGSLRPVDPDVAANLLLAFAIGLLALGLLDPSGADWGQAGQQGMSILLKGLQSQDEPEE